MAKNRMHLKRTSMPNSWPVKKKNITFVAKPNPGSHKQDYVASVVVVLRDVLGYVSTSKEAKRVVYEQEILLNGKKVVDIKTAVGMFDVLEIKAIKEKYTLLFNEVGRIKLVETKDDLIYLKVAKKTTTPGKKFQLNFMNGFNILVDEKTFKATSVADTVIYDFVKKKVKSTILLKEGNFVYVFDGKFKGQIAKISAFTKYYGVSKDLVELEFDKIKHNTSKDYVYVIGAKKEDLGRFE